MTDHCGQGEPQSKNPLAPLEGPAGATGGDLPGSLAYPYHTCHKAYHSPAGPPPPPSLGREGGPIGCPKDNTSGLLP